MKNYRIRICPSNKSILVQEGTTLLEALRMSGEKPDAPCGGKGTCGKCQVTVLAEGFRKVCRACQTVVDQDMTVELPEKGNRAQILSEGRRQKVEVLPGLDFMEGEQPESGRWCLMSFDIGTTTIAGYLMDGITGEELARDSCLNSQIQFGADVISRAVMAVEEGTERLTASVRSDINGLAASLAQKGGILPEDVALVSVVGNSCMHHLFLGITPKGLLKIPYMPEVTEGLRIPAADCRIKVNSKAELLMLPNIAGFVGADTAACMLWAGFDRIGPMTLLLDIGTNGEMVLGNKDRAVSCSTAAGPAFEGARIECGMRGKEGAIDHVFMEDGHLSYSVIGGGRPEGICGSGLLDAAAFLMKSGFLLPSGRMQKKEKLNTPESVMYKNRIREIGKRQAFVLAEEGETADGRPVYISQKDIRELQLGKGAIASGISLLCRELGIQVQEIEQVMIAGAFGNYMDPRSACEVGMIPSCLLDKIISVGNAAGEGARIAVLNREEYERSKRMAASVEFLELASDPLFQKIFIQNLDFPEQGVKKNCQSF
ncbi:ASKHA domain-containing protein [Murimonas intestini]|uniref:ASKHA domain-containing protein n=1 Tax=Murimonas intestini TaxID=1337051 RepID=UPI0011DE188F|nr:ASKHA domain-containing protein [Murimonas intestini]